MVMPAITFGQSKEGVTNRKTVPNDAMHRLAQLEHLFIKLRALAQGDLNNNAFYEKIGTTRYVIENFGSRTNVWDFFKIAKESGLPMNFLTHLIDQNELSQSVDFVDLCYDDALEQGQIAFDKENHQLAMQLAKNAIEKAIKTSMAAPYTLLVKALMGLGLFDECEDEIRFFLSLHSCDHLTTMRMMVNLAACHLYRGLYLQANTEGRFVIDNIDCDDVRVGKRVKAYAHYIVGVAGFEKLCNQDGVTAKNIEHVRNDLILAQNKNSALAEVFQSKEYLSTARNCESYLLGLSCYDQGSNNNATEIINQVYGMISDVVHLPFNRKEEGLEYTLESYGCAAMVAITLFDRHQSQCEEMSIHPYAKCLRYVAQMTGDLSFYKFLLLRDLKETLVSEQHNGKKQMIYLDQCETNAFVQLLNADRIFRKTYGEIIWNRIEIR